MTYNRLGFLITTTAIFVWVFWVLIGCNKPKQAAPVDKSVVFVVSFKTTTRKLNSVLTDMPSCEAIFENDTQSFIAVEIGSPCHRINVGMRAEHLSDDIWVGNDTYRIESGKTK